MHFSPNLREPAREHPRPRPVPPRDQFPVEGGGVPARPVRPFRRLRVDQKLVGHAFELRNPAEVSGAFDAQRLHHRQPVAGLHIGHTRRGLLAVKLEHVERHPARQPVEKAVVGIHRQGDLRHPGRYLERQCAGGIEVEVSGRFLEEHEAHVGSTRLDRGGNRPGRREPADLHPGGHAVRCASVRREGPERRRPWPRRS